MLEIRILGPLDVLDDDRRIELGGARQRAVLAILVLHRGETVSVDRIVDLMWGERPPATAVKTIQVYVSHLRRALVEDTIVSSRGGYALVVDAERIDALRFERLVDEGRAALSGDDPARAAELLRSALALWRGPALGDLAYERFAQDAGRAARGAAPHGGRGARRRRPPSRSSRRAGRRARGARARPPAARAPARASRCSRSTGRAARRTRWRASARRGARSSMSWGSSQEGSCASSSRRSSRRIPRSTGPARAPARRRRPRVAAASRSSARAPRWPWRPPSPPWR